MSRYPLLGISVAIALAGGEARADTPQNIVLADLGLHVVGLGYQRAIDSRFAGQVAVDLYAPWTQLLADDEGRSAVRGGVVRVRVFAYLDRERSPRGWWLSPFGQIGIARGTDDKAGLAVAGGAAVGYAWILPHSIALAVGLGVQYHDAATEPGFSSIWPHADLIVGRAF